MPHKTKKSINSAHSTVNQLLVCHKKQKEKVEVKEHVDSIENMLKHM